MKGEWFKKIGADAAAYLLAIALFTTSSAAVFYFVLSQPERIKSVLKDSGTYDSFVDAVTSDIIKHQENPEQQQLGDKTEQTTLQLKTPAVQRAAKKAFPPEALQTNAEKFVDGTYAWLNGKTENPRFTLDFTGSKNTFAAEIGKHAKKRASKLPPCSFQNIPSTVDPYEIDCLPPGITPTQIGAKTTLDVRSDKNFLPNPKITPDNIFPDPKNNPFKTSNMPEQFRFMKILFWLLIVFTIALTATAVFLSANRLKGLKKAARSFLAVGIFVALTPLLLGFFSGRLEGSGLFNDSVSQQVGLPLLNEFIGAISTVYYIFGGICIVIGVAGFIAAHKLRPSRPNTADTQPTDPTH
jgi:hypothetical protein